MGWEEVARVSGGKERAGGRAGGREREKGFSLVSPVNWHPGLMPHSPTHCYTTSEYLEFRSLV